MLYIRYIIFKFVKEKEIFCYLKSFILPITQSRGEKEKKKKKNAHLPIRSIT